MYELTRIVEHDLVGAVQRQTRTVCVREGGVAIRAKGNDGAVGGKGQIVIDEEVRNRQVLESIDHRTARASTVRVNSFGLAIRDCDRSPTALLNNDRL